MEKQKQQPQRLQSLDALRGFDMLFIMGGASLFVALATIVSESFFSGDSRADGTCGMERVGTSRHDLPIVPLYCGYLVSVLTREATRKRYDGRGDL